MKKAIKGLIIAASVAAVVGVAGVSFAKWAGDATEPVEFTGATGAIQTLGELSVEADAASLDDDSNLKALVPADQGTVTGAVNYWKFTLSVPDATGGATPTYSLAATLKKGTGTEVGAAKLYWLDSAPNATTPETTNEIDGGTITPDEDGVVYVYMVATGTDAMNADITLTFSAA
ncbi:MAG: hypothetical protein K2M89_00430 [Clostridiales bacterium]|nr:hypothetical protein [Clostridiales bacterium]